MHPLKKIFTKLTGYWIHKVKTLPIGTDFIIDIHDKIKYPNINLIFDVGANTGQTVEWLRNFLPHATIYSFEPVSSSFAELKQNLSFDKNTVLEQLAMGDTVEKKSIKLFDEYSTLNSLKEELMNHGANAKEEEIRVSTIDQYCTEKGISKIDLLKIDTEGYELKVLKGAENMLTNNRIAMIYCEVGFQGNNDRNTGFSELCKWLDKKEYYFFGLYQLDSDFWNEGKCFGNALFVQRDLYKL